MSNIPTEGPLSRGLREDNQWDPRTPPPPAYALVRPRHGLAVAGLVLGIVGSLLGLVPILGLPAVICGVLAVVFGAMAWHAGRAVGIRQGRAGMILGVIAIVLGMIGLVIVNDAINDLGNELDDLDQNSAVCDPLLNDWVEAPIGSSAEADAERAYEAADCGQL